MLTVMFVRAASAGEVDVPWPRVLLADGDPAGRQALRNSLLRLGFDVVATACEAPEALQAAFSLKPDVILLDVGFPGGFGALQSVRRDLPMTQMVMVHGGEDIDAVDDAIVDAWGAGRGNRYGAVRVRAERQATRRVAAASSTSSKAATSAASVRSPQPVHAHATTSVSPEASTAA
jgi:DNA-binding NarL/FixJ family response regulator